jgi:hypothetical protein
VSRSFPLAEFALALLFAEPLSQTEEDFLTGTHTRQAGNLKDGERDNGVGAGTASKKKKGQDDRFSTLFTLFEHIKEDGHLINAPPLPPPTCTHAHGRASIPFSFHVSSCSLIGRPTSQPSDQLAPAVLYFSMKKFDHVLSCTFLVHSICDPF